MLSHNSILEFHKRKKNVQTSCFSKEVKKKKELVVWYADVKTMDKKETVFIYQ